MSLQIIADNSVGAGVRADLGTTDDVFVGVGANVASTTSITIYGSGSNQTAIIEGMVTGVQNCVFMGDAANLDSGEHVVVGARGGISTFGNSSAVVVEAHDSRVENHGAIWSESTGVYMQGVAGPASASHIANDGSIIALSNALFHAFGSTESLHIENSGLIQGGDFAFVSHAFAGNDQIINTGTMIGVIEFGAGDDLYDGHAGVHSDGYVAGHLGDDTILGGAQNDYFGESGDDHLDGGAGNDELHGGADTDTLLGGAGADKLDGGAGADLMRGGAGKDIYWVDDAGDVVDEAGASGVDLVGSTISFSLADTIHAKGAIENLQLLGSLNINGTGNALSNTIAGNDGNNALFGGFGNDTLFGGGGIDTLDGGRGHDLMSGGAGNDVFRFDSLLDSRVGGGRNSIADFDDYGNDRIDLSAVYGGTLHYVGNHAFTGAGQVHVVDIAGPDLIVEVNLAGSLAPDMQILLAGTTLASMTVSDFIL